MSRKWEIDIYNECPMCGYSLMGLEAANAQICCPECGNIISCES